MNSTLKFKPLQPKIVLGIAAHPDDLDFGAAGSMAAWAAQGAVIHYLIITDGSKGSADTNQTSADLIKMRQAEQQAAVKALDGKNVTFLDYPDGELEVTMALKRDVVKAIRTVKPDVVVTMDPSMLYSADRGFINHPDHRAAGQAALDAVYPLARDHLSFPELYQAGLQPHKTPTILLINFDSGNFCVDITDTFETKMAALQAHSSQVDNLENLRKLMHQTASEQGKHLGCALAECFIRIDLKEMQ